MQAVHWAIRAVTSVVFQVFGNIRNAWSVLYGGYRDLVSGIDSFATAVRNAITYTLRVVIPGILRWAGAALARLAADLARLGRMLLAEVSRLTAYITARWNALYRWVLANVWAPLQAYARSLYHDLIKWGYTAWWWITHLPALAEQMIFALALSAERHAWQLAGMLGKFALSLVLHNAKKLAILVEDIVTAVI